MAWWCSWLLGPLHAAVVAEEHLWKWFTSWRCCDGRELKIFFQAWFEHVPVRRLLTSYMSIVEKVETIWFFFFFFSETRYPNPNWEHLLSMFPYLCQVIQVHRNPTTLAMINFRHWGRCRRWGKWSWDVWCLAKKWEGNVKENQHVMLISLMEELIYIYIILYIIYTYYINIIYIIYYTYYIYIWLYMYVIIWSICMWMYQMISLRFCLEWYAPTFRKHRLRSTADRGHCQISAALGSSIFVMDRTMFQPSSWHLYG